MIFLFQVFNKSNSILNFIEYRKYNFNYSRISLIVFLLKEKKFDSFDVIVGLRILSLMNYLCRIKKVYLLGKITCKVVSFMYPDTKKKKKKL